MNYPFTVIRIKLNREDLFSLNRVEPRRFFLDFLLNREDSIHVSHLGIQTSNFILLYSADTKTCPKWQKSVLYSLRPNFLKPKWFYRAGSHERENFKWQKGEGRGKRWKGFFSSGPVFSQRSKGWSVDIKPNSVCCPVGLSEPSDSCTINMYQDLTILIIGDLRDTHCAMIRSVRVLCRNNFLKNNHIT